MTTPTGTRGARLRAAFLLATCALMAALAAPPVAYAYEVVIYDSNGNILSPGQEIDVSVLQNGLDVHVYDRPFVFRYAWVDGNGKWSFTGITRYMRREYYADDGHYALDMAFRAVVPNPLPGETYRLYFAEAHPTTPYDDGHDTDVTTIGFTVGSGGVASEGDAGDAGEGDGLSYDGGEGSDIGVDVVDDAGESGSEGGGSGAVPDTEGPDEDSSAQVGAEDGMASEQDGPDDASALQQEDTAPVAGFAQASEPQQELQAQRRESQSATEGDSAAGDPQVAANQAGAASGDGGALDAADDGTGAGAAQPGGGTTWRLVGTSPGGSPTQSAASGMNLEVTGIPRLWLALCLLLALSAPVGAAIRVLLAHRRTTAPSRLAL